MSDRTIWRITLTEFPDSAPIYTEDPEHADLYRKTAVPYDVIAFQPTKETYTREQLESGEFIEAVLSGLGKTGWEILYMGTEGFAQDARPAFIDALDAIHKGKGGEDG